MMDTEQAQDTFLSHLIELRNRLLWSLIAVGIVFLCLVPWAKDIYHIISQPMNGPGIMTNSFKKKLN